MLQYQQYRLGYSNWKCTSSVPFWKFFWRTRQKKWFEFKHLLRGNARQSKYYHTFPSITWNLRETSSMSQTDLTSVHLSPYEFSKYLTTNDSIMLLSGENSISEFSSTLTQKLLNLNESTDLSKVQELLHFRYYFTFWSDVTKIAESSVRNSQGWSNRLKESGSLVTDVQVRIHSRHYFFLSFSSCLEFLWSLGPNNTIWYF